MARYLLMRLCENAQVTVVWHCKPLGMDVDWNGSGICTPTSSTKHMRRIGGKGILRGALLAAFDKYKNEHIAVYGPDNHLRLTGLHETQSIDKFNYGVANRGASVRVPVTFPTKNRIPGLPGRPPSQLRRRPLQNRQPHTANDCDCGGQVSNPAKAFASTALATEVASAYFRHRMEQPIWLPICRDAKVSLNRCARVISIL